MISRIARIIGKTSREVYGVGDTPPSSRTIVAQQIRCELRDWHVNLPPHLGTIKPSTLIPSFRRQAIALQLAYGHATVHVNRPFLLIGDNSNTECITAAKKCLEVVDKMAGDSTVFHSFWWTHYVAFCALTVVYVWDIQRKRQNISRDPDQSYSQLFDLAERCRSHLMRATTRPSPSRRYNLILEELRSEIQSRQVARENTSAMHQRSAQGLDNTANPDPQIAALNGSEMADYSALDPITQDDSFDQWQSIDWLALDSSVRVPLKVKLRFS